MYMHILCTMKVFQLLGQLGVSGIACSTQHLLFLITSVWEKIKDSKTRERWQADNEEEYEDTLGNVVTKRIFEDLRRQGLL